ATLERQIVGCGRRRVYLRDAYSSYVYMRLRNAPQCHGRFRQRHNHNRPLPTRRLPRSAHRPRSSARSFYSPGWTVRSVRLEAQDGVVELLEQRDNLSLSAPLTFSQLADVCSWDSVTCP